MGLLTKSDPLHDLQKPLKDKTALRDGKGASLKAAEAELAAASGNVEILAFGARRAET